MTPVGETCLAQLHFVCKELNLLSFDTMVPKMSSYLIRKIPSHIGYDTVLKMVLFITCM